MAAPIINEQQYDDALARMHTLMQMDIREGSDQSNELEKLVHFVEVYEKEHYSIKNVS